MMVQAQRRRFGPMDRHGRRVIAQHHQRGALQRHHAPGFGPAPVVAQAHADFRAHRVPYPERLVADPEELLLEVLEWRLRLVVVVPGQMHLAILAHDTRRSEEHTSELQSLMRNSYAVFCMTNTKNTK